MVATSKPATREPTIVTALIDEPIRALAGCSWSRGTTDGKMPTEAGRNIASAKPCTAAQATSDGTVAEWVRKSAAIAACEQPESTSAASIC